MQQGVAIVHVLLTGASGLVGTWMLKTVSSGIDVTAAVHTSELDWPRVVRGDLRDPQQARRLVEQAGPDVVVHGAYERDFRSIVDATANVAEAARGAAADLVMVSTDAVFAGDGSPRSETDQPDPVWDYGRWKAMAEHIVRRIDPTAAIVRLPLLVSLDPRDRMVERVADAASRNATVGWFTGEKRQPANAADVTEALWRIVELPTSQRAGAWHLPGAEVLTRRNLGRRIARVLGVDDPGTEIHPDGPRPHHLVLTDDRARTQVRWRPRPVLSSDDL